MNDLWDIVNDQIDLSMMMMSREIDIIDGQSVGAWILQNGKRMLQLSSLDALSLARDSRVIAAANEANKIYGIGALASPLVSGTMEVHLELRKVIADFMGSEDALTFTSGTMTNIGAITAIMNPLLRFIMGRPKRQKRVVFSDSLNHESIKMALDMLKAHEVQIVRYRHCDVNSLGQLIEMHGGESNLVVTDAVFSMDGDIAPLRSIVDTVNAYRTDQCHFVIYADSAHDVGVLGENGRGVCELQGVENEVIRMGVLSKAFGTLGGFVAADKWFIDYLCYCNTQMFSMGIPASETAASIAAIKIAQAEPWRRQSVMGLARYLKHQLIANGFEVVGDDTQIVPVIIGNEDHARSISEYLKDCGILCPEIRSPAVASGRARLRISPVYDHTLADMDFFLSVFTDAFARCAA